MNQRLFSVLIFAFVVSAGASLLLYRLIASRVTANAKQTHHSGDRCRAQSRSRHFDPRIGSEDGRLERCFAAWLSAPERGCGGPWRDGRHLRWRTDPHREPPRPERRGRRPGQPPFPRACVPVAVRVNEVVGVAGFVVPGMRVDILIAGNPSWQFQCQQRNGFQDAAAEHRSSLCGPELPERHRGQTGAGPGCESAGHAGAG